jgi:hypothetical protein
MATATNRVTVGRRYVSSTLGRHWMTVWRRGGTKDVFIRVDIDTGAVLETSTGYSFTTSGRSDRLAANPTSVPIEDRFGHSDSCPVAVVPPALVVSPASLCCCPCECGGGAGKPLPSAAGAALTSVSEGWERECDGGGVVPSAADPTDSETWVS